MEGFYIERNNFLNTRIRGYFHQFYTGYRQPENPDFLNTLKNTFNTTPLQELISAQEKVRSILLEDIPDIIQEHNFDECLCISVPRAKSLQAYTNNQLMFKEAVKTVAENIENAIDGTDCIIRKTDTCTTHLRNSIDNNHGPLPYLGIIQDTCFINRTKIQGKNIILIDDIYTRTVNIDEDCIQALLNNGAREVIFYAIGFTRRY